MSKDYYLEDICNVDNIIYLFCRENGKKQIYRDNNYFPSLYILDENGEYNSFDNKKLKRIYFDSIKEKKDYKSDKIYQSDLHYCKEYLIYKINNILPSRPRICFFDIENIPVKGVPVGESFTNPTGAITCITAYDSYTEQYTTWWIEEQLGNNYEEKEKHLINNFVNYIKELDFTMISAHNCTYDYNYLYMRTKRIFGKKYNFANEISPINEKRFGRVECDIPIYYPCGLSVVDFKGLYEKLTLNKKASYALNYLAQEDLGMEDWGETDFDEISEHVKEKNKQDVLKLVELNKKFNVIDYFDKMRIKAKVLWEDLPQEGMKPKIRSKNSRIVDQVVWQIAREKNIILPNAPKKDEDYIIPDEDKKQGAIRNVLKTGASFDVGAVDLTSAYPTASLDFSLSPENVIFYNEFILNKNNIKIDITDRDDFNKIIKTVYFKRNPDAIIPSAIRKLATTKNDLKAKLADMSNNDENYRNTQLEYDSTKGILNSCFLPDTNILTTVGSKNIKDCKIGDRVININPITLESEIDEIIDTQCYDYNGYMYKVFNDTVETTADHKFLVKKNNKVSLETIENIYNDGNYKIPKLKNHSMIYCSSDNFYFNSVKLNKGNIQKSNYTGKVYCVTTKKNHTVYAGKDGAFIICGQCFGVFGEKHFRFYNLDCFNSITSIVRNELFFGMNKIKEWGYDIISYDTDSIFYNSKEDLSDRLNECMKEFGKPYDIDISVKYDFEGYFSRIFINGNCRYYGYQVKNGVEQSKPKVKGLEIKRNSSTKYEKYFQKELLEKVLSHEDIENIIEWIWQEKRRIRTLDLKELAFPVKISEREYTVDTISMRALRNSKSLKPEFNMDKGDLFFYIPIVPIGKDRNLKPIDILAFKKEYEFDLPVDYNAIIEKSILRKAETIFENIDKTLIPKLHRRCL